ncbi:CCHC-type domain-containing protein [Trichonephila inaurata madagascariensis]|uniref:CCHC-type domain-containing protein n=1 Tax=Trichonephila inaurata madagascariensis TaxID=2747483 RepID=A0A8X6YMJ5_9ARAC|nr:CCHC-type domain-containing protein [Trichonephila inaurata madagascariensis]
MGGINMPKDQKISHIMKKGWLKISTRPRPRPRQENRPTQQDTGSKTDLWRTSYNVPICFHCGRPGHVPRFCRKRRRVLSAAKQRRGIRIRWDSVSFSDMVMILNLITSVIEVIRRTLDSIHNAVYQDFHLITQLLGPVRKIKTSDRPSGGKGYTAWEVRPQ